MSSYPSIFTRLLFLRKKSSPQKMARSDEAEAFAYGVYSAIQEIPYGRVTTYGHIAALIGTPQRSRQVGVCLKHLPLAESESPYHNGNVPWQRVINARGIISPRSQMFGVQNQAELLREEGVRVTANTMGEFMVDFDEFGWFPEALPSEE